MKYRLLSLRIARCAIEFDVHRTISELSIALSISAKRKESNG